MVLGKNFHIACICYYMGCIFVDISHDLHPDPLFARSYYCVFYSDTYDDWRLKHYYVAFAFFVLGPVQLISLFLKIGRQTWDLNDTLTIMVFLMGAVVPIVLSNLNNIGPMCALDPTDKDGHAKHTATLGRFHAFILSSYVLLVFLRADEPPAARAAAKKALAAAAKEKSS